MGGEEGRRGGSKGEGGEKQGLPTLVMGASMVMEWIRAIDECRRCVLPVMEIMESVPKTIDMCA